MIQTIGDIFGPIIEFVIYWGQQFLSFIIMMLCNPVIATLIIVYFLARFARWYIRREREKKEMEYLQKPSYEALEIRIVELTEELRDLRRKIRQRAFRD